jgi:Putative restriction endonuclease
LKLLRGCGEVKVSLTFDLGEKLALYKNAGIKEYWVIDLNAKQLHCFAAPAYKHRTLNDHISPEAWPDIRIDLAELFGDLRTALSGHCRERVVLNLGSFVHAYLPKQHYVSACFRN